MSAEWWWETLHIRPHFHLEVLVNGNNTFCFCNFDQQTHFQQNQQFSSFFSYLFLNPSRRDSRKVLPSAPGSGRRGQRWSEVKVQDVSHRTRQGVGHIHWWRSQKSTKTWQQGEGREAGMHNQKKCIDVDRKGKGGRRGCCKGLKMQGRI